jgi:hypothetical protein
MGRHHPVSGAGIDYQLGAKIGVAIARWKSTIIRRGVSIIMWQSFFPANAETRAALIGVTD